MRQIFKNQIACCILMTATIAALNFQTVDSLSAQDPIPVMKQDRPEKIRRPAIIEFHGPIDWQLSKYFFSRLKRAEAAGVDLLILEIDSPGGLKSESLNIAEILRDIDWAYTVAFVPREAISGGALVTLGCDELVVNQKARLGDIGIIQYDPQLFAFRFAPAKVQSVLVRQARDLATAKGRPPELAEAMIDKDVLVFTKPKLGGLEFTTARVDDEDKPVPPWRLIEESGPERFLTVSGARAEELGFAQSFASDRSTLAKTFALNPKEIQVYQKNATDSLVYALNHPVGTGLLVIIGLIALYIELSAPGIGAGGLVAGLCAVLFFWSRFLGGTSTWLEIILFLAGAVFLVVELFVIPGWGVSGLMGLLLIVASVIMASQDFIVPQTNRQWNQFLTSALMLMCSGFVVFIAAAYITKKMGHLPVFNKMILPPPPGDSEVAAKERNTKPIPMPHPDVSVGDWGKAESLLRPAGRAVFVGRSFDVVSDGAFIEPERQIKVIAIQGNRIVVAEIEENDLSDTVHRSGNT